MFSEQLSIGWPRPSRRAAGSRSDKKLHHPRAITSGTLHRRVLRGERFFGLLDPHGAASCRFATRPVLCTRPGHPPMQVPLLEFTSWSSGFSLRRLIFLTAHHGQPRKRQAGMFRIFLFQPHPSTAAIRKLATYGTAVVRVTLGW